MGRKKIIDETPDIKTPRMDILPRLYLDIFEANPSGMRVMDDLTLRFLMRPSVITGEPEHMTFVREGERNVLLYIYQQIADAKS